MTETISSVFGDYLILKCPRCHTTKDTLPDTGRKPIRCEHCGVETHQSIWVARIVLRSDGDPNISLRATCDRDGVNFIVDISKRSPNDLTWARFCSPKRGGSYPIARTKLHAFMRAEGRGGKTPLKLQGENGFVQFHRNNSLDIVVESKVRKGFANQGSAIFFSRGLRRADQIQKVIGILLEQVIASHTSQNQ